MNYRIAYVNGLPFIVEKYRNDPYTVIPPFYLDEFSSYELFGEIKAKLGVDSLRISPLVSCEAEKIKQYFANAEVSLSRDLADYFYSTGDLINLSGKKFHQKRNHVNSFVSKYSYTYIQIKADDPESLKLLKSACDTLYDENSGQDLADEHIAINEMIEKVL